jgi:hypothetical protein
MAPDNQGIPTASCISLARAGRAGGAHASPEVIQRVTTAGNDHEWPGLVKGLPASRALPAFLSGCCARVRLTAGSERPGPRSDNL